MPTPHIAALLREREHYVRRGLPDKAAAVTAVLERLGYVEEPNPDTPETTMLEAPPETVVPPRPRPRKRDL